MVSDNSGIKEGSNEDDQSQNSESKRNHQIFVDEFKKKEQLWKAKIRDLEEKIGVESENLKESQLEMSLAMIENPLDYPHLNENERKEVEMLDYMVDILKKRIKHEKATQ